MSKKFFALALCLALALPAFSQKKVKNAASPVLFEHPWQGRRVAYFGDSITDPRNSGSKTKWWQFLHDWLGIEPYVYAVSGRQWNDIPRQADQLLAEHGQDFDAILVFIGTNDYNAAVPIGEWFVETEDSVLAAVHRDKAMTLRRHRRPSMDSGTYRGRINRALEYLKSTFPTKQIVLLTPIHRAFFYGNEKNIQPDEGYQNECHEWFSSYVESVKQAGNIWAVPVIDLNAACGLYPLLPQHLQYSHNERDLLHPNDEGHRRMARTVMYQLVALPCVFDKGEL